MRYKLFGKSGLRVSEMALGTMTFGEDWGWGASKDEARRIFEAYAEAGGNFIDTANNYTGGTSERFVGEFIASDRQHFVVATKYTLSTRHGDPNFSGNHRKNMQQALEASLRHLNTDYVDIYWLHAWDFLTPLEEIMRAFDDLVRQGKVLYIGISDTPAWIVSMANTLADWRGWTRFTGLQIRYSLADRAAERDLLPMARALGLAVTPWSILGAGVLTGKYNEQRAGVQGRAANWTIGEQALNIAREVSAIAQEIGASASQVAIAWLRQQRGVIIPLLGALNVTLEADHMARLEAVSRIDLGFPHDFLSGGEVQRLIYGGTGDQIDAPRP